MPGPLSDYKGNSILSSAAGFEAKARIGLAAILILGILIGACAPKAQVSLTLGPFVKHGENPILTPPGRGFEAVAVFNPAVIHENGRFYMLYRAEDWEGVSTIGLAESEDGVHFTRRPEPVVFPEHDYEQGGGCEDPRVVKVGDTYYLTYTAYDLKTARLALATSQDLVHWQKHGLVFPERGWTKSGAILSEKVKGKYVMYFGDLDMWIAYSDDLIHWTAREEPVLRPRKGYFDSKLVEPGPPPILTEEGILLIYNGANEKLRYSVGWVLFDKDDPTRVLARAVEPILEPETSWEKFGQVPNVTFAEGLVTKDDTWYLYYGAADMWICLATWRR